MKTNDTVENIKIKIKEFAGFPCERQNLIFSGKALEDLKTLSYYDIQKGNTLNVVPLFYKPCPDDE